MGDVLDGAADGGIADEGADPGGDAFVPPAKPDWSAPDSDDACDTENEIDLELDLGDTNATAGPTLARYMINRGLRVQHVIRAQEFLNYYSFDYASAAAGTVAIAAELAALPDGASYELQIGVRATATPSDDRRPYNLALLIDTSDAMSGTPIQRVKQACVALANSLVAGDVVSLVASSGGPHVLLASHAVDGAGDTTLIDRCNSITAGGVDGPSAGLATAYELADGGRDAAGTTSVILLTDGSAGLTVEAAELIAAQAGAAGGGIPLMVAGVGSDSNAAAYDDLLLSALSDIGGGSYAFLDSAGEAAAVFGARLPGHLEVAAREVEVELTMPPSFALLPSGSAEYQGGPPAVGPQHLGTDRTLVLQRRLVSCDPAVVAPDQLVRVAVTAEDPTSGELRSDELEARLGDLLDAGRERLAKGRAVVTYAETLAAVQAASGDAAAALIDAGLAAIAADASALDDDPDLAEITALLQAYRAQFE